MQVTSSIFLEALHGSHTPFIRADVWYEGSIVAPNLDIVDGEVIGEDDGESIRHRLNLTVADTDGLLVPRSETSPLAVYGQLINVRAGIELGSGEAETVSMGWFRNETSEADEEWALYERAKDVVWVSRGASIPVTGVDRAQDVRDYRFLAPEQPASLASVRNEIKRLVQDVLVVGDWPGVADQFVPSSITYGDDRWAAVCDLAKVLAAVPMIDPNGDLVLRPEKAASVWEVGAADLPDGERGVLVKALTRLSRDGISNAAVSRGEDAAQVPVQATVLEPGGALRFGGPFGRVPFFHSSPLITVYSEALADAQTTLRRQQQLRSFPLQITCVCNYALQVGDVVTVATPWGKVNGRVQRAMWPLTPAPMALTVVVPRDELLSQWQFTGTAP